MTTRVQISVALILIGFVLVLLPLRESRSLAGSPGMVLSGALSSESVFTPDQVARMLVSDDTTLRIIDIRPEKEYRIFSIPGAINIPFTDLAGTDPATYLAKGNIKNVFYSNGSLNAGYALILVRGFGYDNSAIMAGGMNEWIRTVMNTRFGGGTITARENAIFETRTKAIALFTEFNSMPDSLKTEYLASKRFDPKKLDGGCN
jgi:rhodanese-related sulfurtransferase